MTAKLALVPITEMTPDDFKKLNFREIIHADPTEGGWIIPVGKNQLKVDPWGRVFYKKKRFQEDWSAWGQVKADNIQELSEWVAITLDL